MITSRPIEEGDRSLLDSGISQDKWHKENKTDADFFYDARSACNLYSLDEKPVLVLRATKALRVDIQFLDNEDHIRNGVTLLAGFEAFINKARESGFTEIVFESSSPLLISFCKRKFKYESVEGELRLRI